LCLQVKLIEDISDCPWKSGTTDRISANNKSRGTGDAGLVCRDQSHLTEGQL